MAATKRIIVTGATGLIGSALCKALQQRGDNIIVFSRHPQKAAQVVPGAAEYVEWEPGETGGWAKKIDGVDSIVNLAGGPIFTFGKRQTLESIHAETQSRIRGIRGLAHAISEAHVRPQVFVSASSVGTYGYAGFTDNEFTESSLPGTDFWGRGGLSWEEEALEATHLGVRTVVLRTGYVLDAEDKGGLSQQVEQFRRGFGGPVLPGRQWLPWIHIADEVGLILLALENEQVEGPLNATAPDAIRNRKFATTLGKVVGKSAWMPIPGFALQMGLGVTADIIIHGRRVVPAKALELGYRFQYPTLEAALRNLVLAMPEREKV